MKNSSITSKLNSLQTEIEFALILVWALLYPRKETLLYITVQALLFTVFSLTRLLRNRILAVTPFSRGLAVANLLFIASALFSANPGRSLLAAADILLLSLYMILLGLDRQRLPRFLGILSGVISVSSLANVAAYILHPQHQGSLFFANPILQGVSAGAAIILLLARDHSRWSLVRILALTINLGSLLVSASKAAWLGTLLVAAILLLRRRARTLPLLAVLAALILLIPNPTQRMVKKWATSDLYALNRLDIWSMSGRILYANPWIGIGPEMFYEHARIHNFPQTRGPSRFGKVPESPHSDYLKVACETGLPGTLLLLLFLGLVGRKLLTPPRLEAHKLALLYLLLEAALFNVVFAPFYAFLFLFLLKPLFTGSTVYSAWSPTAKGALGGCLIFIFFGLYLLPLAANRFFQQATRSNSIVERFDLLNRAERLDFQSERIPLARARLLADYFSRRHDLEAWTSAMDNAQLAQRRNRLSVDARLQEANLYIAFLTSRTAYPQLEGEILRSLRQAMAVDPHNPFIRLKTAFVYLQFNRDEAARCETLEALRLEPDFVAALQLLHDRFQAISDSDFQKRLQAITAKARTIQPRPGTYLSDLYAGTPAVR
jgi:O-antigen ligase